MAKHFFKSTKIAILLLVTTNVSFLILLFSEWFVKIDSLDQISGQQNLLNLQVIKETNHNKHIDVQHKQINNTNTADIIDEMINWSINPTSICFHHSTNNMNLNNNNGIQNELAIVTVSDLSTYPHPRSWLPLSRMNKLQYAYKYNYSYCDFPTDWDFGTLRESRWIKFGVLHTMLKYYKYIVWMDTDTLFWDQPYISFDSLINKYFNNNTHYTNLSIIFSNHGKNKRWDWWTINSGIFLIKNDEWSFNFLSNCYIKYVSHNNSLWNHADQDAIKDYIEHYDYGNKTDIYNINKKHTIIISNTFLQSIYVQISPQKYKDDYKKLIGKRQNEIIFHRVAGGRKKYFQMNDVAKDWIDPAILNKMIKKCPYCFSDNRTYFDVRY